MADKRYDWWQFANYSDGVYRKALAGDPAGLRVHNILDKGPLELRYVESLAKLYFGVSSVKGRALDVGCGGGYMTHCLRDLGLDASGTDISEKAIELARQTYPGIRFFVGDGADPQLAPTDRFDFVLFRAFHPFIRIDDLPFQLEILRHYADHVVPGGLLVIMNPTPSTLNLRGLKRSCGQIGLSMAGPFYPNMHKRLRVFPRTKADTWLGSVVSGLVGKVLKMGLISVSVLQKRP